MQPEPPKVFNTPIEQSVIENAPPSSQHGLLSDDQQASLLLSNEEQGGPDAFLGEHTNASIPLSERVATEGSETTRLNQGSPLGKNKIADYENASPQPARKRSDGPAFEVIKRNKKAGDSSSPISTLPNEVLTHALSHLAPNDLSAVSLVSRRFNDLVTTPHAWRVAFARYFPGAESLIDASVQRAMEDAGEGLRSERRSFTRLTALASWRSEYILRTRLLRSLARGKPVQAPVTHASMRSGQMQTLTPAVMYNAQTFTTVNHLHATFGTGLNKRHPRFIHGADDVGVATSSDPANAKVDAWGLSDPQMFLQFAERFPGDAQYGLGPGEIVGCPNVMDLSQPHGMVYGEGSPSGLLYYRHPEEMRGRFIAAPSEFSVPELGIPRIVSTIGAVTSVWIAKNPTIPSLSEGLIGILAGSASGIVTACSLGTDGLRGPRLQRGELTARWVLSPGVPIVAIAVDDCYSLKRQAQNRIWAVAVNALGELYYLTKFPTRATAPQGLASAPDASDGLAWLTGRSVYWNLVEPSRREARSNPYNDNDLDGSYSPRSSWDGMCLSKEQVRAETKEIQEYLKKKPKEFRKSCTGWDMQRRLEVDFAGDDGSYAGEALVVFDCGLNEGDTAQVKRFTRLKTQEKRNVDSSSQPSTPQPTSLFGGSATPVLPAERARRSSYLSSASSPERSNMVEEWRCSDLSFGGLRAMELTTMTLDISMFATVTMSEDPVLGFSGASTASSPYASPQSFASQPASPADIPGQRSRFVAAGTKTGIVIVWDVRAPVARSAELTNTIEPIRIIYTESPEISCLALTALYLVHGGNDGLVQAWDPLASTAQPIRTLNSRFSSRARRRLVQAQASAQGVGINLFAAGAICLDPEPTVLRGMVSLGTQLKYWSYSSSAADQYKSSKRRLRRSMERGSNAGADRFSGSGRGNLKDYIANEKSELEWEKEQRRKRDERLKGRFGVDLLGDEEEALAYAALLSKETMEVEAKRRANENTSAVSSATVTPEGSIAAQPTSSTPPLKSEDELDADIAEAIRLSLQESPAASSPATHTPSYDDAAFDIPIRYAKNRRSPTRFKTSPKSPSSRDGGVGSSNAKEMDDLEFALQLSLAEEESRKEREAGSEEGEEFPALSPSPGGKGKGKGKGRVW